VEVKKMITCVKCGHELSHYCDVCHDAALAEARREEREAIERKILARCEHVKDTGSGHALVGLYAALGIVRALVTCNKLQVSEIELKQFCREHCKGDDGWNETRRTDCRENFACDEVRRAREGGENKHFSGVTVHCPKCGEELDKQKEQNGLIEFEFRNDIAEEREGREDE